MATSKVLSELEFVGHGYSIERLRTGWVLWRFAGSPGEYEAAKSEDGLYATPEEAFERFMDDDRQATAAEKRCPQM